MADAAYWIGSDGNLYGRSREFDGVRNFGRATNEVSKGNGLAYVTPSGQKRYVNQALLIDNPTNPGMSRTSGFTADGGGGGGADAATLAELGALKSQIKGRAGDIDAIYNSLFGDVDNLLRARDQELTTQYAGQRSKATEQYVDALPAIDQSYSAIGSYDSTQRGDSRGKAKKGYEDTLGTIGTNEQADKAKLGQYGNEQKAKFTADRESAKRNLARVDETSDVSALRSMRNELEGNLDTAGVTRATLGTDGQAAQSLRSITGDNGRADAAINALDSIIKSSLGSDVKAAAVKAVTDSAGLSDEDKKRVQAQFGNVYAEQAAL